MIFESTDLSTNRSTGRARRGLSLMEVMFAIGILFIGIVGLAHVLPVGMSQSADAISADKAVIAMENLVSQTIVQAENATRDGFVIADVWNPLTGQHEFIPYRPSAKDFRFGVCIDPWFLTSAYNNRNDTGAFINTAGFNASTFNGYDRSLFPCYDRCYNPLTSPAAALYNMGGGSAISWGNFNQSLWSFPLPREEATQPVRPPAGTLPTQPRFLRVAPGALLNAGPRYQLERQVATQSAEPALITPDADKTLPAGRRFTDFTTPTATYRVRSSEVGRYSAMSFIVSKEGAPDALRVSTAVMKNRSPVIDPGQASGDFRFNLSPYFYNAQTAPYYEGEQVAFVQTVGAATQGSFAVGLGGQVEMVLHRAVDQPTPKFRSGQYLMFFRHVYPIRTAFNGTFMTDPAGPERLAFDWFKIVDVVGDPVTDLEGEAAAVTITDPVHTTATRDVWRVTLDLRGPSWLFDDGSRVNYGNFNYTPGTFQDATFVAWMPDVVEVHERSLSLKGR